MGAAEGFAALGLLCFLGASVAITVIDARFRRVPNRIVLPALAVMLGLFAAAAVAHGAAAGEWFDPSATVVARAGESSVFWPPAIPAVTWLGETFGGATLFFALALAGWLTRPGALGGGDVKAAPLAGGALGFVAGWPAVLWGLFLAAVIAGAAGAMLAVRARRGSSRPGLAGMPGGETPETPPVLPFTPALFVASWAVLLFDAGSVVLGTLS